MDDAAIMTRVVTMNSWKVGSYSIYQLANRNANRPATIYLHEDSGSRMASLLFISEGPLPENKAAETRYDVYFHFDQFLSMMQMLREEKPIYFHYSDSKYAQVSTNPEPIGEAEIG
jgi:hypothetical protein